MTQFKYGTVEIAHLKACDPTLGGAIDRIGWIEREMRPAVFPALVHSGLSTDFQCGRGHRLASAHRPGGGGAAGGTDTGAVEAVFGKLAEARQEHGARMPAKD